MPNMPKTCARITNSSGLRTQSWIFSLTHNKTRSLHLHLPVTIILDPPFPQKKFNEPTFHENPGSFRYPQSNEIIGPQSVPAMHHNPMPHHESPKFHYKSENPPFLSAPKPDPFSEPGSGFRPSRSRPSFSDNASLEMLYSFFSSNNF